MSQRFLKVCTSTACKLVRPLGIILNCDIFFRTSDADHPGPYKLKPICDALGQTLAECWCRHPTTLALEIFLCFLFIREFLELSTRGPREYLTSKENYLQVIIYILTVAFIVTVPTDMVAANHLAAWAVFWECLNITQLFGRVDFFGKGIFMALDVSKEIAKMLFVFAPSMVAFILAFNMMFQADPAFHGLPNTSVKIFVMMQGEFDFDDNLSYQKVKEDGGRNRSIQVIEPNISSIQNVP